MSVDAKLRLKQEIIDKYGEWTDHNVQLGDDFYTIDAHKTSHKLRRLFQVVSDVAGRPLKGLRVLDLACLEGLYAIECALQGAEVVGIEGREASVEKARFVKEVLGLENLSFFQDDVRNLSRDKYGEFDIVICSGILYHLDAPAVFEFIENIHDVCRRFAVIDTYVSLRDKERFAYKDREYWGRRVVEHSESTAHDKRLEDLWASLDNPRSVWLTRQSLLNLLTHVGFSSTYENRTPVIADRYQGRITIVAIKGIRAELISQPWSNGAPLEDLAERCKPKVHPMQSDYYDLSKRLSHSVPGWIKKPLKKALGVRASTDLGIGMTRSDPARPMARTP